MLNVKRGFKTGILSMLLGAVVLSSDLQASDRDLEMSSNCKNYGEFLMKSNKIMKEALDAYKKGLVTLSDLLLITNGVEDKISDFAVYVFCNKNNQKDNLVITLSKETTKHLKLTRKIILKNIDKY